jgi:hypothetical protein
MCARERGRRRERERAADGVAACTARGGPRGVRSSSAAGRTMAHPCTTATRTSAPCACTMAVATAGSASSTALRPASAVVSAVSADGGVASSPSSAALAADAVPLSSGTARTSPREGRATQAGSSSRQRGCDEWHGPPRRSGGVAGARASRSGCSSPRTALSPSSAAQSSQLQGARELRRARVEGGTSTCRGVMLCYVPRRQVRTEGPDARQVDGDERVGRVGAVAVAARHDQIGAVQPVLGALRGDHEGEE